MQSRHTSRAVVPQRPNPSSDAPVAESVVRLKRAPTAGEDLRESVKASIAAAIDDLDSLELPISAPVHDSLQPPQQMPKGMPPLPFGLNLPSKMPPLPPESPVSSKPSEVDASRTPALAPATTPRKPFSIGLIVVVTVLGLALLGLALLWHGQ